MPLDALKNGLCVRQLRQLHDIPDDPARQLHAGVLVLGLVRKAAHGLRLDGVVQVHQHVQPLGALEAQTARHTGLLCGLLPQRLGSIGHAAHGAVIVHKALILLRRVAVPHAFRLPQGHAVAPCLGHRLAPASVPLHKLGLRLPALVHGVLQLVQLRVLVPQFAVAVHCPVLDLPCQRLGQRFGLVHVRAVRLQVVHQHFGLLRQLCPVRLAAVGLQPAPGQLVHRAPAHVHALCQPKKLAQCVQRRRLLRDHPAGLLLLVPLRVPARLFCQLVAESCQLAFLCQLPGPVIVPDFPHHFVCVHAPAVFLACRHAPVCCRKIQRELPALTAQLFHHVPDLFQLLCSRFRVCRKVNARCFCHHAHIAVQQKLVQCFRAGLYFRRAEHLQNFPVVGVPATVILGKVQHLAVRQNVPCPPEFFRHAELLLRQHPPVLRIAAVRFGSGIVGVLCILGLGVLPLLQTLIGCFHLLRQGAVPLFQRGQAAVVLLALCKVVLVFCAVPVGLALCGKNAQRLFLCLDPLHFGTVQPCTAFFLQGTALLGQLLLFGAQLCQLILLRQLIAHIFLHSCIVFLAFGRGLCYSSVRRYFLSIRKGAPHSFRELCGSIFFFCHISLSVKRHIASICPAYLMNIEILHAILPGVFSYNHAFIQLCSVNFDGRCKDISIIPSSLPVLLIPDLLSFLNYFGDCSNRNLFCFAVPMLHRCTCTALCQLHRSEVFTNHFVSYRIKEFFNIGNVFVSRFSERHLCSFDCRHRFHFFQFVQMAVHLLHQRIFSLVQLEPHPLRRTLTLEGCGVFFCRAQGVHGLFRVGKVFLLQRPLLGFRQSLGFQGCPVLRVLRQHFLCPAHDVAQKVLHRVHHLADGPRPACVLLRLPALELHPPLEALLAVKDAAPRIGHHFLGRFAVGQALLCVVGKFIPDQLVNVLKALALGQILHHMLLHLLCALGVQSVIPVPVLVQHGAEHVSRAVCKKDLSGSRVHIGLHPLIAFQHCLQHRIGVGRPRVQLDQLRGHLVCRAHGAFVQHPSAAAHALCAQRTARCPGLHGPGFRFALALQPRDLQRRFSAGLCQHIVRVHRKAVHTLRQLHSLVKGGHVLHLSQPVQAGGRRRIPALVRNARRHVPAQRLCRALAYLPAQQLPLYAALLRALAAHFQPGRLPQGCRFRLLCKGSLTEGAVERMRDCGSFHRFPGVFHAFPVDIPRPL